jgi:hypothetical protein
VAKAIDLAFWSDLGRKTFTAEAQRARRKQTLVKTSSILFLLGSFSANLCVPCASAVNDLKDIVRRHSEPIRHWFGTK